MKAQSTPAAPRESIFSKSLDVIRYVATHNGPITLKDLANDLGIRPPTGHRIVQELESHGWIIWDREQCIFDVGPSLAGISATISARYGVESAIRPLLKSLARSSGETVCFFLYEPGSNKLIAYVVEESEQALRCHITPGETAPLHAGAAGRTVMAYLPKDEAEAIVGRYGLPALTEDTITDAKRLRKTLQTIRDDGYAFSKGERVSDVAGIAAPIFDARGGIAGSLLIAIPQFRFSSKDKLPLARQAIACAAHTDILLGPIARTA